MLELRVVVSSGSVMRIVQEDSRHYPMFRHRSATPAGVAGNPGAPGKPGGQRSLDRKIGRERVSRLGDCQHHGGREPAVRDRVNLREVPIKVVNRSKPKMLSGLDQNGMWSRTWSSLFSRRGCCTTGRQARPKSRVTQEMNELTPLSSPTGKRSVKDADETAGKGRGSKPMPIRNRSDRG
jgi:hypothetical protein